MTRKRNVIRWPSRFEIPRRSGGVSSATMITTSGIGDIGRATPLKPDRQDPGSRDLIAEHLNDRVNLIVMAAARTNPPP
jgi:hypothetical protein